MTSPFIPNSFTYGDAPQGGAVMPTVVAGRNPSDTTDTQYASGYLWLSDLQQGGSGNLYVQAGNTAGLPNWTSLSAGSAGGINTLSDGSTQVSPVGGNIALEGTAGQITVTSSAPSHNLTFSLSASMILPGTLTVPGLITGNNGLTISAGGAAITGNSTVTGDLNVTGALTAGSLAFTGLTVQGTVAINTVGAGTTTIGNTSAGAITIAVGTGNFQMNGLGHTINIGNDAAANTILIGSTTALASTHIQSGTGDVLIDGSTTAQIIIGALTQTGLITLGRSTAGQDIDIGSGINVLDQTIDIGNGASAGNSTVRILSGLGTSGAGVLSMGNNTRVTTIGLGNVAPAAARAITIAGGNQAQNDTVTILGGAASAGTQVFNLFSGNSAGATQTINMATGTGAVALNIGTGTTGVKTIAIGGTAANVITIGNTQTAGSVAVGAAMTTGTITIGGTGLQTGTVAIAPGTGAQTITIGHGGTGAKTIQIGDGAAANTITIGNTNTTTGVGLSVGTGNFSLDGVGASTYTFGPSTTGGVMNFGGTGAATGTMTIAGGTGAQALNIANSTGGKTVAIATGAGANAVTIGSTNTTSTTTINAGSGNIVMVGAVTKTTNPAFLSYLATTANNKTGNGTAYTLGTDALTEVFDRGGNITTGGTFTAPVTGIYDLRAQVAVSGCTIATTFTISIVTTARTYTNTFVRAAGSDNHMCEISALCDMSATNTATVTITVSGEAADTCEITGSAALVTYFCGCLVA